MENSYGVGVTNRYELFLDEEEDPLEALKLKELEKESRKKTKQTEKEKGKTVEAKTKVSKAPKLIKEPPSVKSSSLESPNSTDLIKTKANTKYATDRKPIERNVKTPGDERLSRRNRDDRPPHVSGEFRGNNRSDGQRYIPRDGTRENQRGGQMREGYREGHRYAPREARSPRTEFQGPEEYRGRGLGMRGAGGRGRGSRGPRDFDRPRREYGGKTQQDKLDYVRAHDMTSGNWEAVKAAEASIPSDAAELNASLTLLEGDVEDLTPVELEPEELTLDEYKAMRSSRQKPTFNLRKAGEGEDLTQWKTMYALTKNKIPDEEEDSEYDVLEYPQRVGRQKHLLEIDIRFADTRRSSRGRGGRGGYRGGGFRGDGSKGFSGPDSDVCYQMRGIPSEQRGRGMRGNRGHRGVQRDRVPGGLDSGEKTEPRPSRPAPKVDDEHDFPSLG